MAEYNAFEELRSENEARFSKVEGEVKRNVEGRKDFWTLMGELVELFIPRIISTFLGIKEKEDKK